MSDAGDDTGSDDRVSASEAGDSGEKQKYPNRSPGDRLAATPLPNTVKLDAATPAEHRGRGDPECPSGHKPSFWTWLADHASIVIAVATVINVSVAFVQWRAFRENMELTGESLRLANRNLIESLRSRLVVTRMSVDLEDGSAMVHVENMGKVPGHVFDRFSQTIESPQPIPNDEVLAKIREIYKSEPIWTPGDEVVAWSADMPITIDVEPITTESRRNFWFMFGGMRYRDAYDNDRSLKYCYFSRPFVEAEAQRLWIQCPFHNSAP